MYETWSDTRAASLPMLRAAYQAEVERFAETLRPRFEAGELRGMREADFEDGKCGATSPHFVIEEECGRHFGIEAETRDNGIEEGPRGHRGDMAAAHIVLAASPHTESTADNYSHPCYHAQTAAAWDVIALARARGWYAPTGDESEDPAAGGLCSECEHRMAGHRSGACGFDGCDCQGEQEVRS